MRRPRSIAGVRGRLGRLRAPHSVLSRLLIAGLVVTALVATTAAVVETALGSQRDAARSVERTDEALVTSYLVERETVDLETGLRGYEATGDRLFLAPWTRAVSTLPTQLAQLRRQVAYDPRFERPARALESAIGSYISGYGRPLVDGRRPPTERALDVSLADGKRLFDAIRRRFQDFNDAERARERADDRRASQTTSTIAVLTVLAAVVVALALVGLLVLVFRTVVVPLRRAVAACARVSAGERDVKLPSDGRSELGELGAAFNVMVGDLRRHEQELARAAERARGAEERFRQTFESAPIGMSVQDLDGRFVRANQALCELVGYGQEELSQRTVASITHPDDRAVDEAMVESLLRGSMDDYQREKRYVRESGEVIWVSVHVTVLHDQEGKPQQLLAQAEDISLRRESEERLRYLADHDGLTGLFNRGRFARELEAVVARARRYPAASALLMIDLDKFKAVNDTYGHAAGDEVLSRTAATIREQLRETDVAARLGGDEFAVILPHTDEEQAQQVAARLKRALRDDAASGVDVTASVGIATIAHGTALSADELLIEADRAMYEAKHSSDDRTRSRVS